MRCSDGRRVTSVARQRLSADVDMTAWISEIEMTLILTELTPFGIAMAADSAVTFTHPTTGYSFVQPNAAAKLQSIPSLNAGVSCWGIGAIEDAPTDEWLAAFILQNAQVPSIGAFAAALASALQ